MRIALRRLAAAPIAVSLLACDTPAPPAPAIALSPARDTVLTPYLDVTQTIWLSGHRWAVVSPASAVVAIVDFGRRSLTQLGGTGANEVRNPSAIFLLADTLYVSDWGLRRISLWTPDGRLIRAIPATAMIRGALPRAADAAGHFYVQLAPSPGPDGAGNRDSAVVVRTQPGLSRGDTVARISPLDIAEVLGDQGRRFERRVFSGVDDWGALPDGSVWVARVYHNRVDWRSPDGRWTQGRALPDRVLEVTRYDREMFIRNFPPELRATARQLPFAPLKPPFEDAFEDPLGNVWLVKSRAPIDSAGRYHVVGRQGNLLQDLRVPGPGRATGAARDAVVVVERSREGIRLLRFARPPLGQEAAGAT